MVSVIAPVYPVQEVVCDQCGKIQWNLTECAPVVMTKKWKGYAGCVNCGHPEGRYSNTLT